MRLCAIPVAALAILSTAQAENPKQIIARRYAEVTHAMQTRQLGPIDSLLAPDFKAVAPNGKSIGKSDVMKQFQFQADSVTDLSWPRRIVNFKLSGNSATVVVAGILTASTRGKAKHHLKLVATTKDLWTKSSGKWLLNRSQVVESKMTMDGKPLNMPGR